MNRTTILSLSSHACMFYLREGQIISHSLMALFPHIDYTFPFLIFNDGKTDGTGRMSERVSFLVCGYVHPLHEMI